MSRRFLWGGWRGTDFSVAQIVNFHFLPSAPPSSSILFWWLLSSISRFVSCSVGPGLCGLNFPLFQKKGHQCFLIGISIYEAEREERRVRFKNCQKTSENGIRPFVIIFSINCQLVCTYLHYSVLRQIT